MSLPAASSGVSYVIPDPDPGSRVKLLEIPGQARNDLTPQATGYFTRTI